jgi:hypothetical protein
MFDASDLRGQRIVLGMPPLAPLPGRNRCAPIQTNARIIRARTLVVKVMKHVFSVEFFSRYGTV